MPAPKLDFSRTKDHTLKNLAAGEYADTKEAGLRLVVSGSGHRGWELYRWNPATKRPVRRALGSLTEVKYKAALEAAKAINVEIGAHRVGANPTLAELVAAYEVKLKLEGKRDPDWARHAITLGYGDWLGRRVGTIAAIELETRHLLLAKPAARRGGSVKGVSAQAAVDAGTWKLVARGPQSAARSLKALRAVLRYAKDKGLHRGDNVALTVKPAASALRDRALDGGERQAFEQALDLPEFAGTYVRDFMLVLLHTGARWGSLAAMRWADVDLVEGLWVVPADVTKMGKRIEVVLDDVALDTLKRRQAEMKAGRSEWAAVRARTGRDREGVQQWVWPSPKASKTGHITEPSFAFKRVLKAAGIDTHTTPHDLRRTLATELVNADVPVQVAAKVLGHENPATTAKFYARVRAETARAALAKAAAARAVGAKSNSDAA